jgi:uncharacterized protein (TIGR03083 family)
MNREENLIRIRVERGRLEAVLARLTPAQWLQPGACGPWTPRDLLGHIVHWEQHFMADLECMKRGEPLHEIQNEEVDAINAAAYQRYEDLSLEEMQAEFSRSHRQVLDWLRTVPEEDLRCPYLYKMTLGEFVEMDTWGHYAEHLPDLEKFLSQ